MIVPGDERHDDAVRALVIALVRQGVTSTLSTHDGSRYGVLHIDSNLPDVRLAIGGPAENDFVRRVLDAADPAYKSELDRQLAAGGSARLWIPATDPARASSDGLPDRRGLRDLPVLIVAGADPDATNAAIGSLAEDLDDATIAVEQPLELDGTTGEVEDYTVAVLNRGLPGFNVEAGGQLYLSLMRSCSGWPSGVWIDPPRRAVPDGSNFQFQHWTHTFEYAITGTPGDWRSGRLVQAGHDFNNPLVARVFEGHEGDLPATASLIEVEPASVVLTAVKPAGNPMARMAAPTVDPTDGLVFRLYESSGVATRATIRCQWPIGEVHITNVTEEEPRSTHEAEGTIAVQLEPFEILTVRAVVEPERPPAGESMDLAPIAEAAQPVFSGYWMHNKGAAPLGYQPVTVQIRPWLMSGDGPFNLPVVVASERTDAPSAGTVTLVLPDGWEASPSERLYRLAPGAHLEFDASIVPAPDAAAGRYFVAARIVDEAGQQHEDVVTIDLHPGQRGGDDGRDGTSRNGNSSTAAPSLAVAIARALRTSGIAADEGDGDGPMGDAGEDPGGELVAEVLTREVTVRVGEAGEVRVSLRNEAASEIRGEAQILSPHETWPAISPWTQGFVVGPGEEQIVTFAIEPPYDSGGGTYWALVKVMYFGRLLYTESIPVVLVASEADQEARSLRTSVDASSKR